MNDEKRCPQCGAKLPGETPEGLCPACLLQRGLETQTAGTGGAPEVPSPTPEALAGYFPQLEIVELLGRGGMGAVYKARHKGLDRWVALKILPSAAQRNPSFAERFSREARALARLDHPNIVTVYDSGEVNDLYFFVMEYVDGANLRQVLAAGKMSPVQALAIVPQICDALQYAHDKGIVHRDIKPENILIDQTGRVKIADFGIAKIVGREARDFTLTSTEDVMGTPAYMAPEQVEHPSEVDHRADIFSLGVVFYQMLTGELPLGRFAPPSRKVRVDVRLDEVVLRALEKEPERRYQQAGEVKTEVETIAGSPGLTGTERLKTSHWNTPVNYRSKATLFGLPLVHITQGVNPATGRKLVARGIIAIGDIAQGVIAIGGCAMGGIALGGAAFGVISVGGLALGLWAFAGMALGLIGAWGGFALAPIAMGGTAMGYFAKGGRASGMHVWDSITKDVVAVRFFQDSWSQKLLDWMPIASPIFGFVVFAIGWGAMEWAKARENRRTGKKPTGWWLGLLQFAGALLILALFGVSVAGAWNAIQQRRQQPARSTTSSVQESRPWVMSQNIFNDIQPNGTIRVKSMTEKVNLTGTTVSKDRSGSTSCANPTILDSLGHPMAVEVKRLENYYEWWVTLNQPVPPGGIITLMFPEETRTGEIKKVSDFGLYEYTMKHWPAVSGFTRYVTVYRLPAGAKVMEKYPPELTEESKNGQTELHLDQMIPAGRFVEIRFQYQLKTPSPDSPTISEQSPLERFRAALQEAVDRKDKDALLALFNWEDVDTKTKVDFENSVLPLIDQMFSWPGVKVKCERFTPTPSHGENNGKQYTPNGRWLLSVAFQNTDPAHKNQGPVFPGGLTSKGMRILVPVETSQAAEQWQSTSDSDTELLSIHGVALNASLDTKDYPLTGSDGQTETIHLEKSVLLDWLNVRSVKPEPSENSNYTLRVTLDEQGTRKFAEITARHLEKRIGIVVDGRLLSAPMVRDPIFGGNFTVGNLSEQEARDLAAKLTKAIETGIPEPSATPNPNPSPVASPSTPSLDMKNRAVAFVDLLAKGDFAKARAEFDTTMSSAMSEQMLGNV